MWDNPIGQFFFQGIDIRDTRYTSLCEDRPQTHGTTMSTQTPAVCMWRDSFHKNQQVARDGNRAKKVDF